jgi:hypothetical protein
MELGDAFRTLFARRLALAAVVLIALAVGVLCAYKPSGFPPTLEARTAPGGVATKQILVESPRSPLTDLRGETEPQSQRTGGFAQLLASRTILEGIAEKTGIPVDAITVEGPFVEPANVPGIVRPSEARGLELLDEEKTYRLRFITPSNLPIVSIQARGPSPDEAAKLADGAFASLQAYLTPLAEQMEPKPTYPVLLRDLGPASSGISGGGMGKAALLLGFGGSLLLGLLAILGVEVARRRLRPAADRPLRPSFSPPRPRTRGLVHRRAQR